MMIADPITVAQFPGMSVSSDSEPQRSPIMDEMRPERIAHRLTLLREAHGLSKSEIADYLGIERTYWSRFEGGKRAPSDMVAALLVERFGITLDWLILGRWGTLPLDLAQKLRAAEKKL